MESSALVPRKGSIWSRDAECAETIWCAKGQRPLATGASYAMIVRTLGEDNAELDKRDGSRSTRSETTAGGTSPCRTWPEPPTGRSSNAGQRRTIDFIEGVATALTPIAFFETVMVKSYETLVDSNTKVDVNTGIVAAGRLQSLIDSRDYGHELLVMKVQMAAICDAVKSTVPQEMWSEIIEKLDEAEQHRRRSTSDGLLR